MKKFFAVLISSAILLTSAVSFAAPSDNYGYGCGCGRGGYGCWR